MCRPIYVYVPFRTEGRPVTQTPATPLPPPEERRRLREAASLTQAQVATRVGVSRETVRAWENGRTTPRGHRKEAYAQLLRFLAEQTADQEGALAAEVTGSQRPQRPLTPAQAFDALYAFCAPALVRQTYLLTGRRELARESVERAFQLAWQRWPEVARDPDPKAGYLLLTQK